MNRQQHRRAAAMIEMVLSLPLIFVVLALIFFFGSRMGRLVQTQTMTRYETWRMVHNGPGPAVLAGLDTSELNVAFMGDNAQAIDVELPYYGNTEPYEAVTDFADEMNAWDADLGEYTDELIDRFPGTVHLRLNVTHASENNFFSQLDGEVSRRHVRIAQPWWLYWPGRVMYEDDDSETPPLLTGVSNETILRDTFFSDFDDPLENMADGGNDWAEAIRNFYIHWPGYQGPTVWSYSDD